jgi:biopolymer transport protein TolR
MAMNIGGSGGGPVSDMNVTPMIDVLLVLIIVFMIINAASKSTGEEALVPQPPTHEAVPPPTRTIVVQVVKSGDKAALTINQEPVAWESLRERLFAIYKTRAERIMFVKADKELPFEDVAAVIDIAHLDFSDMKVGLLTAVVEEGR